MELVTLQAIQTMAEAAKGYVDRIYLHWSAGHYGSFFNDYHINIDYDGSIYISTRNFTDIKAHTWRRNTGSIGVTLACCYNATSNNLGQEPPTEAQIEIMAQVIAALCKGLELPCDYSVVRTHGEQADEEGYDAYGPRTTCERWDLAILHTGDEWCSGGDILRGKANWYLQNG